MRKLFALLSLLVVFSMALTACGGAATATQAPGGGTQPPAATPEPEVGYHAADKTTFVFADNSVNANTLDPALAYDNASGDVIQNVYETLIFYDGEEINKFVPMLASEMPTISADGLVYTFKIRPNVKFHNGDVMTPGDVAYTFQRGLLQANSNSPQLLLTEPFFGIGIIDVSELIDPSGALTDDRDALSAIDPAKLVATCEQVKAAIVADDAAGTVTFTLKQAWGPFLATIAQTWGAVMDKKWVIENGGWDGTCETWQKFYAMAEADDPFTSIVNGTGPFKLEKFVNGEEFVYVRNDDYWGEPAKLERIIHKQVPEWGTRLAMIQTGDADIIRVEPTNRSQMDALVGEFSVFDIAANVYGPLQEVCAYDANGLGAGKFTACAPGEKGNGKPLSLRIGRPMNNQDVMIPNWSIANSEESPNPLIGSGKLDGNGVPPDFFGDVHIRRALGYCFDYASYINDELQGEGIQSTQLPMAGMVGYDENMPHFSYDPAKCEEEFKLADLDKDGIAAGEDPEGDVWTVGFRVQMVYNQGNTSRQNVAEQLAASLASINELFLVEVLGIPWPAYLRARSAKQLPIFTAGWIEDFHDPYNWFQPYTYGTTGGRQGLPAELKDQFRTMLQQGVAEPDEAKRAEIYKQASQLYYDNVVSIPLDTPTSHSFRQRWVKGQVFNPMFMGLYYYTMYKE